MKRLLFIFFFLSMGFSSSAQKLNPMGAGIKCQGLIKALCSDTINNLIYAGGYFDAMEGLSCKSVSVYNGIKWDTLGPGLNGQVMSMCMHNGELFCGGQFTCDEDPDIQNLARWDGSHWHPVYNSAPNNAVWTVVSFQNTLIISGSFSQVDNQQAFFLAAYQNGNWMAIGSGVDYPVTTMKIMNDTLYCAGNFNEFNGDSTAGLAWIDASINTGILLPVIQSNSIVQIDSYKDSLFILFNDTITCYTNGSFGVITPAVTADKMFVHSGEIFITDRLHVSGAGTSYDDYRVQKFNSQQQAFETYCYSRIGIVGAHFTPSYLAFLSVNSDLYIGGTFITINDQLNPSLIKCNGNVILNAGKCATAYVDPWQNAIVLTTAFDSVNNKLYAGGTFLFAGNKFCPYVAVWDGTDWAPMDSGLSDIVRTLEFYNGNLVAGGSFQKAGFSTVKFLSTWNGSKWTPFTNGPNKTVTKLIADNNDLYIAGNFDSIGGLNTQYIAKYNGNYLGLGGSQLNGGLLDIAYYHNKLFASRSYEIYKLNGGVWSTLINGDGGYFNINQDTLYIQSESALYKYVNSFTDTLGNYTPSWSESYRPLSIGGASFAKGEYGLYKEINDSLELVCAGIHAYTTVDIDSNHTCIAGIFPYRTTPTGTRIFNNIGILEFVPPSGLIERNRDTLCNYQYVNYACYTEDLFAKFEWHFPGGIPALSTQQYPIVQYPNPGYYTADVMITNLTGSVILSTQFGVNVINCSTGLEEAGELKISAYPNPVWDQLTISNNGTRSAEYEIMDLFGRTYSTGNVAAGNQSTISLSSLASGQYLIRLFSDSANHTMKIIKL